MSVPWALEFWLESNGCQRQAQISGKGSATVRRYAGGRAGAEVMLVTVKGGKHAWPGGRRSWLRADRPAADVPATDMIWDFFASHVKP